MSSLHDIAMRAMRPAIVAVGCVLATALAVNAIVALARAAPHVGDIVAFAPTTVEPSDEGMRLLVRRRDRPDCILDLNVVRRSGGSVVVESELVDQSPGYLVHWAGLRTSDDSANCGGTADLTVDHRDLDILALAAGGYGVDHKQMPVMAGNVAN